MVIRAITRGFVALVAGSILLTGTVFARTMDDVNVPQLLQDNWQSYQQRFIQADGRVIDHRIGITTSEGQSYAMLRALWMRDKAIFDKSYDWAVKNLQKRPAQKGQKPDHLFGWKWGQLQNQQWGLIDSTAATDADQDIALALILAHKLWGDTRYRQDALALLNDIWNKETVASPIGHVVLPGDWKFDTQQIQLNPSYFAPYAYRIFADFDKSHDWQELTDSSYVILRQAMQETQTHLPPDWVSFSLLDGKTTLYTDPRDNRSDYGYEAIRVFWRLGVDALLNQGQEDMRLKRKKSSAALDEGQSLLNLSDYLARFWQVRNELPGTVSWNGIPRNDKIESAAVYGAVLPGFYYQQGDASKAVLNDLLLNRVIPNMEAGGQWNTEDDYYSQNWLWFGLASYAFLKKDVQYPKKLSPLGRLEWFMDLRSY